MLSKDYRTLQEAHDLFTWSGPVGYDFEEVEETINQYKETISQLATLLKKREELNNSMKSEIKRLTDDLTDAQLQMTAISVPNASDSEIDSVLNDFGLSIEEDADSELASELEDHGHEPVIRNERADRRQSNNASNNVDNTQQQSKFNIKRRAHRP